MDYPNREALGLDPPWVEGAGEEAAPRPDSQRPDGQSWTSMPGEHAELDELAERTRPTTHGRRTT